MRGGWKGGGGVSTGRDSRSRWLQRMVRRCGLFLIGFGRTHQRDCVEKWLELVSEELAFDEIVEVEFEPGIARGRTRNGLEKVRWAIKRWVGQICIQVGLLCGKIAPPDDCVGEWKMVFLASSGENLLGVERNEPEIISVARKPEVDSDGVNVQRKILRAVDDRYHHGRRTQTYCSGDAEWLSSLYGLGNQFERMQKQ